MDNEYTTKDLGESAALITKGLPLKSIQWKDKTAFFLFGKRADCETASHEYYYEACAVNARIYYENLKMIKRKLYANEQKGGGKRYV